jgi:BASS family bile acid:Na+ symporter
MNLTQIVPVTLALIMFSMGLSLRLADFKRLLLQPRATVLGLACQLVLLPLSAYVIGVAFRLEGPLLLGLILLALCPGGVTSNLASKYAGGDVALSVSLTAISSVFTVFSLPLVLNIAAYSVGMSIEQFSLPLIPTITELSTLTIVPLLLAMLSRKYYPNQAKYLQQKLLYLATSLFLIVIAMTWFQQWEGIKSSMQQVGLAVLSMNLFTMLLGWYSGRILQLPVSQRLTLVLEVGLQNSVLAFTVAFTLMGNASLAIPAAFYSVVMVCSASLVILFSQNIDTDELSKK